MMDLIQFHLYILACLLCIFRLSEPKTFRIDSTSTANNPTGNNWNFAYPTIHEALEDLTGGYDTLWIAAGHYYQDSSISRAACYNFTSKIDIYGGFSGTESSVAARPFPLEETIIDGDIGVIGDPTDNCYHIFNYGSQTKGSLVDGIIFQNGYAMSDGDGSDYNGFGGVLQSVDETGYEITFQNCTFRNNTARQGGVFYIAENDDLYVIDSIFENNEAVEGTYLGGYGGVIASTWAASANVTNSQFINNVATYRGGAIYGDYGSIMHFDGCTFEDNSAPSGHGGAIFFEDRNSQTDGTYLYLKGSTFRGNTAKRYGGAVCMFNGPFISIRDTTFDSNIAQFGGAITNYDQITYLGFSNNQFLNNMATANSNYNDMYNDTLISLDTLKGESALVNVNLTYYLYYLYNNYGITSEYNTERAESSTICRVDASNGDNCPGPQCNSNNYDGSTWNKAYYEIQDCIDEIGSSGGEIWVAAGTYNPTEGPDWAPINGPDYYSFILNEGIALYGGFAGNENSRSQRNFRDNPTYLSCLEIGNGRNCSMLVLAEKECILDGFIFTGSRINTGAGGGARRMLDKSTHNTHNTQSAYASVMSGPQTQRMAVTSREEREEYNARRKMQGVYTTTIADVLSTTSGGRGGGVFSNGTNVVIVNSIFTDMIATKGGGLYCIGYDGPNSTSSPTIMNSVFIGMTADRGGAIAGDVECDFTCTECLFLYNRVTEKGGAIYLDYDCDPSFNNSVFEGNEANEAGGCIAADGGSEVFMAFPKLEKNVADWEGGCLYAGSHGIDAPQGYFLRNPYFSENSAPYGNDDMWMWLASTVEFDSIPTSSPTETPTRMPTDPTDSPTVQPTSMPTDQPSDPPTDVPTTKRPTVQPTDNPTDPPNDNSNSGDTNTSGGESFFGELTSLAGENLLYTIIGGGVLLILLILGCMYCSKRKKGDNGPSPLEMDNRERVVNASESQIDGHRSSFVQNQANFQNHIVDDNEAIFQREMQLAMAMSAAQGNSALADDSHRPL